MSDMKISEATRDTNVTGVELLPVSDGGQSRSVSIADIEAFVEKELRGKDLGPYTAEDCFVFIDGTRLYRIAMDTVASGIIERLMTAQSGEVHSSDVIAIREITAISTTEKTYTVGELKDWIVQAISSRLFDFDDYESASPVTVGAQDFVVIGRTVDEDVVTRKVTAESLRSFVFTGFASFLNTVTGGSAASTDYIFVVKNGSLVRYQLSAIAAQFGNVTGPGETTEGNVPQWDSTNKKLKNGLAVTNSVSPASTASNDKIPTEKAVREAIGSSNVSAPATTTENRVPQWDSASGRLKDGLDVATSIGEVPSHTRILTEAAVGNAIPSLVFGTTPDSTINNATASRHGLLPKLPGTATQVLRGDGTWGTPLSAANSLRTLFVPAASMSPCGASGAIAEDVTTPTFAGDIPISAHRDAYTFSADEDTYVDFDWIPSFSVAGSSVKVRLVWTTQDTDAVEDGYVVWGCAAGAYRDGASMGGALGEFFDVEDTFIEYKAVHVTDAVSVAILNSAPGSAIHFVIRRNAATQPGRTSVGVPCQLLGALFQFSEGEETSW